MGSRGRKETVWLLLLILCVAFALRLVHIDAASFWTDEGLTPLRASYSISEILSNRIIIQDGITNDTHPPLYFLLIHGLRPLLGETDFAYRFPSVLASLLLLPVLYQIGQRMVSRRFGLFVTLLAAINPLQIYYANEARMYALLVLLTAVASALLWQALHRFQTVGQLPLTQLRRLLVAYTLFAGLAVYTHYTAAILIAAQGLLWLWLLWRHGQRRLLIGTAVFGILIAIPLVPYTIPRLLSGIEANFYNVPAQIVIQDVVRFFALGRSVDFQSAIIQVLVLSYWLLLLLGFYRLPNWPQRTFWLIYLLAVPIGLIAGSLIKPLYQGVRHIMVGSPALLVLLAHGLMFTAVPDGRRTVMNAASSKWQVAGSRWLVGSLLGLIALLFGAGLADYNLFTDDRYAKDDFRSLVAYIEQQAGTDDVIVYNNAILLPLHQHYQQRTDVAVTAAPIYPYAAQRAPAQLAELAATYERIWFITDPPADLRDVNRRVRGWLAETLNEISSASFLSISTEVGVIVYDTAPVATATLPETAVPVNATWNDGLSLQGVQFRFQEPAVLPTLWLDLFWQGTQPDTAQLLELMLVGADGREWVLASQPLARSKWPTAPLQRQQYALSLPPGTPPGTYELWLQRRETAGGSALGARLYLTDLTLSAALVWGDSAWPKATAARFENGILLNALVPFDEAVRPGHPLPLVLQWQAETAIPDAGSLQFELQVVDGDEQPLSRRQGTVGAAWMREWQQGTLVRQQDALFFAADTPPGRYDLRLQLTAASQLIGARPPWRPWLSDWVTVGEIEVVPYPLITEVPAIERPFSANFGDLVELLGYDTPILSPASLEVTLYWRVLAVPTDQYLTFIHLVSSADGTLYPLYNWLPINKGLRPMPGWRQHEVLTDTYQLSLPPDLPPGQYQLIMGFVNDANQQRLPVTINDVVQSDGQIMLTTLTVP